MLAYPEIMNVRPGMREHPEAVTPIAQAWVSLAEPWAVVPGIKCFEENSTDLPKLISEWRSRHTRAGS